ncbi:MAG: hypothetical protein JNK26_04575, partial [Candidatus Doudnabacteria bacterium]|nr:hypothetical protein [Candidatus Doudnabacteria bacterium]
MGISRPNQQQLPSEGVISSILDSYSGNIVIEGVVYDVSLSDLEKLIKAAGMTYDAKTPKVTLVKNLINYLWQQLPAKDGEALGEELFHLIKTNLSSLEDSTVLQLIYSLLRVYLQPEIDSKPAEPPVENKISPPKYSDEQIRIFSNIIEKIHEVRSLIENVNTIIKLCAEKDPKVYGPIEANDAVGLRKLLTLDESVPPFRGSVARVASQEIASDRLSLAEDADYFNIVRKDIELRIALLKQLLDLNLEKIIIIPGNQLGIEGLDIAGIKKTIKLLEDRL